MMHDELCMKRGRPLNDEMMNIMRSALFDNGVMLDLTEALWL
jgi:hypothetical protein